MYHTNPAALIAERRLADETIRQDAIERAEAAATVHAALEDTTLSRAEITDYLVNGNYVTREQAGRMYEDSLRAIYRGFRKAKAAGGVALVRAQPSTELSDEESVELLEAGERAVGRGEESAGQQLARMIQGPQIEHEKRILHVEKLLKSTLQRLLDLELTVSRGSGQLDLPDGIDRNDIREALRELRGTSIKSYGILLLALQNAYGKG